MRRDTLDLSWHLVSAEENDSCDGNDVEIEAVEGICPSAVSWE